MAVLSVARAASAASTHTFEPGIPYYFDELNSESVPWQPGPERNLEEVFKNYQYFEMVFDDDGRIFTARRYIKGTIHDEQRFRVLDTGGLQALDADAPLSGSALYETHCARCHGDDRLGGTGPALLPGNLKRLRHEVAAEVIRNGRIATQMPAFGGQLSAEDISKLVHYIYSAPAQVPEWDAQAIRASRITLATGSSEDTTPVFDADPLNLTLVVESGDHHITILDGDRLEPIHRFPTRFALHGGLKYSPDGRFVYMASRDGWITKYDLYRLQAVAEVRAGINTRNIAVSADGRFVLAGNYLPHSLVLLDAKDLSLMQFIPAQGREGESSRVSAVYQAAPRNSFIVALKDIPEVWELDYAQVPVSIRRIEIDSVLDDFLFDQNYRYIIGADRARHGGQVIEIDSGKKIATLPLSGMPHLGSGISWKYKDHTVFATPNLKSGIVDVIDMDSWQPVRQIETLGPGFFMRSHENSPYAWVDVFFGKDRDALHVIDKQTLEISRTLRPEPGKTSAHVEFTRDGRYALVSLWEMDGALIVYDARTLEEIKRIPMKKPSGKYNVYNKITRSAGTSH